jgi:hypothetical protein
VVAREEERGSPFVSVRPVGDECAVCLFAGDRAVGIPCGESEHCATFCVRIFLSLVALSLASTHAALHSTVVLVRNSNMSDILYLN